MPALPLKSTDNNPEEPENQSSSYSVMPSVKKSSILAERSSSPEIPTKDVVIPLENFSALNATSSPSDNSATSDKALILNYEQMKRFARENSHDFARKSLPGVAPPKTALEKFENAVTQAKRGDCRTEHAHLGILALPFLLKDTLSDSGCKW